MSTHEQDAQIPGAGAIIERFGGLRPMATKIGVAVTTIQGWKKRDTIPANRVGQIMDAARAYGIALDDLIAPELPTAKPFFPAPPVPPVPPTERAKPEPIKFDIPDFEKVQDHVATPKAAPMSPPVFSPSVPPVTKDALHTTWISVIVLAVAVLIGLLAMGPGIVRLIAQEQKLAQLAQDFDQLDEQMRALRGQNAILSGFVPDQIKGQIATLQDRAQRAEGMIATLGTQTRALTEGVMGAGDGTIEQRLTKVEDKVQKMDVVDGTAAFSNFLTRVQQLSTTPEGQKVLSSTTDIFYRTVLADTDTPLAPRLTRAVGDSPLLKQVVGDMRPDDVVNAVIVLASMRLRTAIETSQAFDDTARTLRAIPGMYSDADGAALDKITSVGKTGAPTLQKLVADFDGVKNKIVTDSLSGDDVSTKDKFDAFIAGMVRIERDGKPITGTAVQKSVGAAAHALSVGDVALAIDTLMNLSGPAATTAQPFVTQAENYLAAQAFMGDLVKRISARISAAGFVADAGTGPHVDVDTLSRGLMKSLITQGQ